MVGHRTTNLALALALTGGLLGAASQEAQAGDRDLRLRFLGEATLPTGTIFAGTEVGGLSGLDYDRRRGIYYAISDDRSSIDPARFYTLSIDIRDGDLQDGDVSFIDVVTILDQNGAPFAPASVDPEAIRHDARRDTLYWTSEGDANALVSPFIREMRRDGSFLRELRTPAKYAPMADGAAGIRNNLAFESLTALGFGRYATATENALAQDGPAASLTEGSPSRILVVDSFRGRARNEYVYVTEPIPNAPVPAGSFATNGLVEILALDRRRFLAVERAFSVGVGNTIKIFLADLRRASNVRRLDSIAGRSVRPVSKRLVLDLDELGITLDNIEGLTFGPRLRSGERTLILVSDNNFNGSQFTQFLAFAVETRRKPGFRYRSFDEDDREGFLSYVFGRSRHFDD